MSSFVILYTSDGQPWRVPQTEVKKFLEQGYRRAVAVPPPEPSPEVKEGSPIVMTGLTDASVDTEKVNINTDSTTKIARVLPGVGTATVRQIKENRPYASIEDLINKVPLTGNLAWTSLEHLITF